MYWGSGIWADICAYEGGFVLLKRLVAMCDTSKFGGQWNVGGVLHGCARVCYIEEDSMILSCIE